MNYQVRITRRAQIDIDKTFIWWSENRDHKQALVWYSGIVDRLQLLNVNPERFSKAPEHDLIPTGLRQMPYGTGRKPTHRALFTIKDEHTVEVLAIRHVSQRDVTHDDLI